MFLCVKFAFVCLFNLPTFFNIVRLSFVLLQLDRYNYSVLSEGVSPNDLCFSL